MGLIKCLKCSGCGYEKDIFFGCGLDAANTDMVKKLVPLDVWEDFTASGQRNFLIVNSVAVCRKCKKLLNVTDFTYLRDGKEVRYLAPCPSCGDSVTFLDTGDTVRCPKCGEKMTANTVGHWD